MSSSAAVAIGGRDASRARRHALSAGKSALPPPRERARGSAPPLAQAAPESAVVPEPAAVPIHTNGQSRAVAPGATSGRSVSMARRHALSAGKAALLPAPTAAPAEFAQPLATPVSASVQTTAAGGGYSCRDQARARRAEHSRHGRGEESAAPPTRAPRSVKPEFTLAITDPYAQSGGRVTGMRVDRTGPVTGDQRGSALPVSGTQNIGTASGAAWRAAGPKVGHTRTPGGSVVSGTLMRGNISITGDEAGSAVTITGEADPRFDDDVTARTDQGGSPAAQFARQADPHGHSVHSNLARSARFFGSRNRDSGSPVPIESSEGGLPITGSAIGRSIRVTGDEAGACRAVTGDQYLAPARRQVECGGPAPAAQIGAGRPDPVTGTKVGISRTRSGIRVTGVDLARHRSVTGMASDRFAAITGNSDYPRPTNDWHDGTAVGTDQPGNLVRPRVAAVTGDTALNGMLVTGSERGAARDITGTPYYSEALPEVAPTAAPVAAIDDRFSVRSPQRWAHLRAGEEKVAPGTDRITGSFAVGHGKLTGNLEFVFRSRQSADAGAAAHLKLTGEGRAAGRAITGQAWGVQKNVTGTEGAFSGARNPSERGSKPHAFAGASRFKALASSEEPKHLVTGMFGYSSDSAAKVTLSGGAQG